MNSSGERGSTAGVHSIHSIEGQDEVQKHGEDAANAEAIAEDQNDGIPANQQLGFRQTLGTCTPAQTGL